MNGLQQKLCFACGPDERAFEITFVPTAPSNQDPTRVRQVGNQRRGRKNGCRPRRAEPPAFKRGTITAVIVVQEGVTSEGVPGPAQGAGLTRSSSLSSSGVAGAFALVLSVFSRQLLQLTPAHVLGALNIRCFKKRR